MRLRIFLLMSVALLGQALGQAEVLLKRGSDWRYLKGSQTPGDWRAADFDDSGAVEITDAVSLLNFLFLGGSAPNAPFPDLGEDPTSDPLDCRAVSGA